MLLNVIDVFGNCSFAVGGSVAPRPTLALRGLPWSLVLKFLAWSENSQRLSMLLLAINIGFG